MQTLELDNLLTWSEPKRVNTSNGERDLCTATPDGKFWDLWRANKDALKQAGISCNQKAGAWEVAWWRPISVEEQTVKAEAREASRAQDYDGELPIPDGLAYLPYQRAGVAYGLTHPNVLIADEMGLGKTIQAIGIVNADEAIKSVLIICPASLKINWSREWIKFSTRGLTVGIANGTFPETDVVIVNYDILKKFRTQIDTRQWDALIADECHYAKNPKAQRTQLIFGNKSKDESKSTAPIQATRRIFLTGTPIVNRPVEMWTLIQSLDPNGLGKNFFTYAKRYCDAVQNRFGWDFSGASNLPELQNRLRESFMVRRLKMDVLTDLPPKTRQTIALPVPDSASHLIAAQSERFEALEDEMDDLRIRRDIAEENGDDEARKTAADALRECASVAFTEMAGMRHDVALAKAPIVASYVKDMLEGGDQKVIVFAHHKDVVNVLMDSLDEFNPVRVTGDCTQQQRQDAVDAFQNHEHCRVFVGNIKAAGVGLTLTAANTVVFAELDWTPAAMSQAEDRAHRIGQRGNVLVLHLVFDGSLDATISKRLVIKQAIIDRALDTETAAPAIVEAVSSVDVAEPVEAAPTRFSPAIVDLITAGLRYLAGLDPDHAAEENGVGFNGRDTDFGHYLAAQTSPLSQRQAEIGFKMIRLYRRQLKHMIGWDDEGNPYGK